MLASDPCNILLSATVLQFLLPSRWAEFNSPYVQHFGIKIEETRG